MKMLTNRPWIGMALVVILLVCVPLYAQNKVEVGNWKFSTQANGTCGWELATSEFYQYPGTAKLSWDNTTIGMGLLRLDVDYTKAKELEWSEVKMFNDFPKAFNMKGKTRFTFDFFYNPAFAPSGGHFKAKVFSNNSGFLIQDNSDEITGGTNAGGGFLKARVIIPIRPVTGFMTDMRFSIAGYLTDYKGPVFFDNLRWE